MDTKLKNRHKLGALIIFLVVTIAGIIALSLYPYMEQKARANREEEFQYYQDRAVENFAPQMMSSVYSIWMEQEQKEAGYLMMPSQIFLPDLQNRMEEASERENRTYRFAENEAEEAWNSESSVSNTALVEHSSGYYENIQGYMDDRGEFWKADYSQISEQLGYQMIDEKGSIVSERKQNDEADQVYTEITFDALGHMTVPYSQNSQSDKLSKELGQILNFYTDYDPIKDNFGYDYINSGLTFQKPANVTYKFWIPKTLLTENGFMNHDILSVSTMQYSGAIQVVTISLIAMVSLFALLLPLIPSLQLGQEKIFRVPFEVVTMVAAVGAVMVLDGYLPAVFVTSALDGGMAAEMQKAGFLPEFAQILVWIFNGITWTVGFAVVYWVITCYRSVFVLGLWRYIKERTIVGRFLCWLKQYWDRFYQSMLNVDFREKSTKIILRLVLVNFVVLTVICCLWFFGIGALIIYSAVLFFALTKYWINMQEKYALLLDAFRQVAAGNFNTKIQENIGIFEPFREELDTIQEGLKQAVDREVRSQNMKTELITNVSHDLKTPLTAIITYVNLLKEENRSEEERASYVTVLEQKSMRLKVLIEDLFEVSKANSNNITLNLEPVDVVNLMKQVRLELSDRILQSDIVFRWELPEEKIIVTLDGQKTCRIFENLLLNIAEYAMPGTRAYIEMKEEDGEVIISMRNISANEMHVKGEDLTERFVRGDESRNTEGSGLGLAIAKSFTEVQGGRFSAETEADLFRVIICWPVR